MYYRGLKFLAFLPDLPHQTLLIEGAGRGNRVGGAQEIFARDVTSTSIVI